MGASKLLVKLKNVVQLFNCIQLNLIESLCLLIKLWNVRVYVSVSEVLCSYITHNTQMYTKWEQLWEFDVECGKG